MARSMGSNPRRQSIPAERPATSDRTTVVKNEPLPKNSLPFPVLSFRGDSSRTGVDEHRTRTALRRTLISADETYVDADGTFGSSDRTPHALDRTLGDFKSNDCRRSPNLERWLPAPRIERESKPQRTAFALGVDVL